MWRVLRKVLFLAKAFFKKHFHYDAKMGYFTTVHQNHLDEVFCVILMYCRKITHFGFIIKRPIKNLQNTPRPEISTYTVLSNVKFVNKESLHTFQEFLKRCTHAD